MAEPASAKDGGRDARLSGPKRLRFAEKDAVRKQMARDALERCHETRDAYGHCAVGRTVSAAFYCRQLFREFNNCLKQYTTDDEFERRLAARQAEPPPES